MISSDHMTSVTHFARVIAEYLKLDATRLSGNMIHTTMATREIRRAALVTSISVLARQALVRRSPPRWSQKRTVERFGGQPCGD
jgi:hypothetical protein